jgi:hypothetical protein
MAIDRCSEISVVPIQVRINHDREAAQYVLTSIKCLYQESQWFLPYNRTQTRPCKL